MSLSFERLSLELVSFNSSRRPDWSQSPRALIGCLRSSALPLGLGIPDIEIAVDLLVGNPGIEVPGIRSGRDKASLPCKDDTREEMQGRPVAFVGPGEQTAHQGVGELAPCRFASEL